MTEFIDLGDKIALIGDFGSDLVYSGGDLVESKQAKYSFFDEFNLIKPNRSAWESRKDEDYYQGLYFMTVIQRKSDGKMFGFEYWKEISKYGDTYAEENGEDHGLDFDYGDPIYVFTPVEPFLITGFTFIK